MIKANAKDKGNEPEALRRILICITLPALIRLIWTGNSRLIFAWINRIDAKRRLQKEDLVDIQIRIKEKTSRNPNQHKKGIGMQHCYEGIKGFKRDWMYKKESEKEKFGKDKYTFFLQKESRLHFCDICITVIKGSLWGRYSSSLLYIKIEYELAWNFYEFIWSTDF